MLKEVVRGLGTDEKVLRLPALMASSLALLLYAWLLSRFVPTVGQVLALALLATSGPILYFAASVKQYSGDVLVTVILLSAGYVAQSTREGIGRFAWLGLSGLVSLFFSQSSVFLLGGIGLTLILTSIADRRFRDAPGVGWGGLDVVGGVRDALPDHLQGLRGQWGVDGVLGE